jgi:hypothetical protein
MILPVVKLCAHASDPTDTIKCDLGLWGGRPTHAKCARCAEFTDSGKTHVVAIGINPADRLTAIRDSIGSGKAIRHMPKTYSTAPPPHWGLVAWSRLFTAVDHSAAYVLAVIDTLPKKKCQCAVNALKYIKDNPVPGDVVTFDYLYRFHAFVDSEIGKVTATEEQARRRWGHIESPRRAIAVGNWFGGTVPDVCRDSFQAAASRWGCEYVELTTPHREGATSAYTEKLWLAEHTKQFDQVVYLDGYDVIVRADCPNLFDLVRVCDFGAVPGFQPDHDWRSTIKAHLGKLFDVSGTDGDTVKLGIPFDAGTDHFNSGVMIFSPAVHQSIFEDARRLAAATTDRHWSVVDEGVISLAAIRSGITTKRLPMTFNRVGGAWKAEKRKTMQSYIQHYCGNHSVRGEIMAAIDFRDTSIAVSD